MPKSISTIIIIVAVLAGILLMMCAFQLRFTETAVITRFDKITRDYSPEDAGLHFTWPWPIERVHRFDSRLRTFETKFRQIGTQDQRTVVLTAYATWRIQDARQFLKSLGQENAAGPKIRDLLENQVSNVLRTYDMDQLVNTDSEKMKFAEIEGKFLTGVKRDALNNYGINVVTVGIKRLALPESVTQDVFTRMKEDRQKTIKQLKAQGEAEAQRIKANAEEIAKKITARAEAYAKTIEGQGDAEAAKYYKVFAEHRELSAFLKKLETIRSIFEAGNITMVMNADDFVPFDILKEVGKTTYEEKKGQKVGSIGASPVEVEKAASAGGHSEDNLIPSPANVGE